MKQLALGVMLRANALFANFYPGPNEEVLAALRRPGADPIWIWGSAGCGKSHLLQAVCAATEGPAAYIPLSPVSGQTLPPEALRGFADCRAVCVDDVDAAAGDLGWEQALFILCVIARQQFLRPAAWVIVTLGALTFLTTAVSGIDYVLRYGKAAVEESRARRALEQKLT